MKTTTVLATAMALATLTATTTALAAATTCNGACPENLKPLCGSDGVTYDNECMLEFARCTAANAGKAPLTLVSAGPCGSNSATLTPAPSAECAKIMCLQMIDPVCGSDGKTYNSACELKQAQCDNAPTLTVKSKGECPPAGGGGGDAGSGNGNGACKPTMCTKEYKPVCGSDNKTYSNKCEFTNAQCTAASATPAAAKLTLKAETACDAASSVGNDTGASKLDGSAGSIAGCVQAVCTREMAPVCGSDGVTYNNACLFANAKCTDATLTQVATGACSDSTATPPAPSTPSGGAASLQVSLVAAVVLSAIASLAC